MLPPIGPEYQQLKRMPLVTLGLLVVMMLGLIPIRFMGGSKVTALQAAIAYRAPRPWLKAPMELEVMVREQQKFAMNFAGTGKPDDPDEVARAQAEMDVLSRRAVQAWNNTAYRWFGFTPSRPTILSVVFHPLFPNSMIFLAINLVFFGFCGAFMEEVWGRVFYPIFLFFGGLISLLLFVLAYPGSHIVLFGPMGMTAAAIGAFTVQYFHIPTRINMDWVPDMVGDRDWHPMMLFPIWFLSQTVIAYFMDKDQAAVLFASGGSFLYGLATVLVIRYFELGSLIYKTDFDRLSRPDQLVFQMEKALAENDKTGLLRLSQEAFEMDPDNPQFQHACWENALGQGRGAFAVDAGVRWIRHLIDQDQIEEAYANWLELCACDPGKNLHLDDISRLIHGLLNLELHDSANQLAAYTAEHLGPGGSPKTRMTLVEAFDFVHPVLCLRLIRTIQDLPDVGEQERVQLAELEKDLHNLHTGLDPDAPIEKKVLSVAEPIQINHDAPSILEFEDTFALTRIDRLQVHQGMPLSRTEDGLLLQLDSGAERVMAYAHMKGLAMVAIRELGGQPFVLLDILVDDPMEVKDRHDVLRLNMRRFNPVTLVDDAATPAEAARALVRLLLNRSGANPLPDEDRLLGQRFLTYPSVEDFEKEIYGVTSR